MTVGKSRSGLESVVRNEINRLSRNLSEDDIKAISTAASEAIYKNNRELENEIRRLRSELRSK